MLVRFALKIPWLWAVLASGAFLSGTLSAEEKLVGSGEAAAEAVARFEKAWAPPRGYMRPLEDAGWKARQEAFQKLVRLGGAAVPALTEALARGEPEVRIFAAQALALLAEPASRPALEQALKDAHAAVRLYAIDALSMFGRLEATEQYRQLRDKDRNRDVRAHMTFALGRDEQPQPPAIQKTLLAYDLARLDTARLGRPAPDFTLTDPLGKTYRLSQFRGGKAVVLVFIYGDT
ncbi:MAG: HEAT repeat domain-containing protein [Gemmataceae bacterium]|nr:HEAT repeat domain-containing protein [Gemmataceae bacterium]